LGTSSYPDWLKIRPQITLVEHYDQYVCRNLDNFWTTHNSDPSSIKDPGKTREIWIEHSIRSGQVYNRFGWESFNKNMYSKRCQYIFLRTVKCSPTRYRANAMQSDQTLAENSATWTGLLTNSGFLFCFRLPPCKKMSVFELNTEKLLNLKGCL